MNIRHLASGFVRWTVDQIDRRPIFPYWNYISRDQTNIPRHKLSKSEVIWSSSEDPLKTYHNHLEMTGHKVSMIVSYGVDQNQKLKLYRHLVFPLLRTIPNDTFGSFAANFKQSASPIIYLDGKSIHSDRVTEIRFNGILKFHQKVDEKITIIHSMFPSVNYPAGIEKITIVNQDSIPHHLIVTSPHFDKLSHPRKGVDGAYHISAHLADAKHIFSFSKRHDVSLDLSPNQSMDVYQVFCAVKQDEALVFDVLLEENKRKEFLKQMKTSLVVETPDEELNAMFYYSKIRTAESIIQTKRGWMHNPGGGTFYAALWTNDQCEYTNPLFPFLGYDIGNDAAINSFKLFMEQMDPTYQKPLVSSIIAEGDGTWNGAGDRGDAAMFAYGASRFCLVNGDIEIAKELWPGIEWCINYSLKKRNENGVIESDSDELENRFESGNANLFTSCLVYDALRSACDLGMELGISTALLNQYSKARQDLGVAIENYFGGEIEGYQTYQYYEGNKRLRAWICIPLTMGILNRAKGTVEALCSSHLWTKDGLRAESGKKTFWDRSTLYALRGFFESGYPEIGLDKLKSYTRERLLGSHVPYPIEAFPEGNQKHLSAESALYARIFLEGILGIRVIGFNKFTLNIRMPQEWKYIIVRSIHLFQKTLDFEITRSDDLIRIKIVDQQNIMTQTSINGRFEVILDKNIIHNRSRRT